MSQCAAALAERDAGSGQAAEQQLVERAVLEIGAEQPVERQQGGEQGADPDDAGRHAAERLRRRADREREQRGREQEEQQRGQRVRAVPEREAQLARQQGGEARFMPLPSRSVAGAGQRQRQMRRGDDDAAPRGARRAARRDGRPSASSRPSVGSSSSQSGARREREPGQREPPALPGREHPRRQVARAPRGRARPARPPHRAAREPRRRNADSRPRSGPASPRRDGRDRRRAGHARRGRPRHPRRATAGMPASGRFSPASSRSSVDLPDPFGPGSSSAPPAATAKDEAAQHQPLAPERRQLLGPQHHRLPPVLHAAPSRGRTGGRHGLSRRAQLRMHQPGVHPRDRTPIEKEGATSHESHRAGQPQHPPHARRRGQDATSISRSPKPPRRSATSRRLPVSLKVLLENVLRFEDGTSYKVDDAQAVDRLAREGQQRPRKCRSARRAS